MKTIITYATSCSLTIHFKNGCELALADWRDTFKTLDDAINEAEYIITYVYPMSTALIIIWDTNTGEILAECYPDEKENEE